jgi:segregation and condensation protein A
MVLDAESTLVVVARFLSLLELYKDGQIRFEQVIALGELQITWVGRQEGEISVSDEFDREPTLSEDGSISDTGEGSRQ